MYRQYLNNEQFGPFIYNAFDIKLTLKRLKPELELFCKNLEKLFIQLYKFLKANDIFIKDPYKLEKNFYDDSKKQFADIIIMAGKYSSGHFTGTEGMFFKEFTNKNFFYQKKIIFLYQKIFL